MESNARKANLELVPLHKKSRRDRPSVAVARSLPLDLGRKSLLPWWWRTCHCRDDVDHHRCSTCRKLGKKAKSLSSRMFRLSEQGYFEIDELNRNPHLITIKSNNPHNGSKHHYGLGYQTSLNKTKIREGDKIFVGKKGEAPWMSFEIRRKRAVVTPEKEASTPKAGEHSQSQKSLFKDEFSFNERKRQRTYVHTGERDGEISNLSSSFGSSSEDSARIRNELRESRRQFKVQRNRRRRATASDSDNSQPVNNTSNQLDLRLRKENSTRSPKRSLFRRREDILSRKRESPLSSNAGSQMSQATPRAQFKTTNESLTCGTKADAEINLAGEANEIDSQPRTQSSESILGLPECPTLPQDDSKEQTPNSMSSELQIRGDHKPATAETFDGQTEEGRSANANGQPANDPLRMACNDLLRHHPLRQEDATWLPRIFR